MNKEGRYWKTSLKYINPGIPVLPQIYPCDLIGGLDVMHLDQVWI